MSDPSPYLKTRSPLWLRQVKAQRDASGRFGWLPLLPPAAMPRCAAGGARGGAEFGAGLARVGGLEDFASGGGIGVVGRTLALRRTAGTVGQGLRAVHFVEMGFVDF